ncbi:MAG: MlaD family protein [Candidatus Binatia bacterium]|nr:MlaD family protein [Candidatus Binatia bacterium]
MAKDSERKREMIVGLFVLFGVGAAVFMVVMLGSEQRIFEDRFQLRAIFGNVSGMRVGAPVFVAGLSVGTVEQLRFVQPGEARRQDPGGPGAPPAEDRVSEIEVVIKIEERFRQQIRQDSIATVGSVGLLGDKSIEVSVGSASEPVVEPGAVLTTVDPLSLTDVLDEVQPMAKKLEQILGDISILTGQMSSDDSTLMTGLDSLSNILQKVDRGEGTIGALVNSSTTVDELDDLLGSGRDALSEIRDATQDLPPTMASVRQVAAEVEELSVSLRETAERFPAIAADLQVIVENLRLASQSLPTLSVQAEQGVRKASDVFDAAGKSILLRGNIPTAPARLPTGLSRSDPGLGESDGR